MFPSENLRVLITSAEEGAGKSHLASALALAAARDGADVSLLDADLRRPALHRRFAVESEPGLADVLTGQATLSDATRQIAASDDDRAGRLSLVPTKPAGEGAAALLASPRFEATLASIGDQTDLLLIDAPPTLAVTDSAILAQHASAVVLVIDSKRSSRRRVRRARDRLITTSVAPIGIVFNSRTRQSSYSYYGT
jgi:capsular exopolysaccharide synthesis family protein